MIFTHIHWTFIFYLLIIIFKTSFWKPLNTHDLLNFHFAQKPSKRSKSRKHIVKESTVWCPNCHQEWSRCSQRTEWVLFLSRQHSHPLRVSSVWDKVKFYRFLLLPFHNFPPMDSSNNVQASFCKTLGHFWHVTVLKK